jgi:WD40 repeat protein
MRGGKKWDRPEAEMLLLEGHQSAVIALAYRADGQSLVSVDAHGYGRTWDPFTGRAVHVFRLNPWCSTGVVEGLTIIPEARTIAFGASGGTFTNQDGGLVALWDVERSDSHPASTLRISGTNNRVHVLGVASDGRRLAAAYGARLLVLDLETQEEQELRSTVEHDWRSLAFSLDGRFLAAGGRKYVSVFDLHTPHPQNLHWPAGDFLALRFTGPRTLATARGREIGLWDLDQWGRRHVLRGHRETVRCLALTPDGSTLVSGGDDWSVRLWDVATGWNRGSLSWRIGAVTALAIAPDGMTAAAGSDRGTIMLWDLDAMDR